MSGFKIKAIIVFWLFVATIAWALITGEFAYAGRLFIYLIFGMILYQVIRAIFSLIGNIFAKSEAAKFRRESREAEIKSKEAENPFACDQCRKRFKLESSLIAHKSVKHA